MKTKWKEVFWVFLVQLILVKCDYFSVVGSAFLRIDEPYKVAVINHDAAGQELEIKVGIYGLTNQGEVVEVFKDLILDAGSTQMIKFQFPNLTLGTYQLITETQNYLKSGDLQINSQKVTVMIQLDKPMYKTTDVVNFRIFAIDSRTKPYTNTSKSKIYILNSNNNELMKWENVQFIQGVFQEYFDFIRLRPGIYEIVAEVDGVITRKQFKISKETDRIYDLKLHIPNKVLFRDGDFRIKISISYASKFTLENFLGISGILTLKCDELNVIKYWKIFNETQYEVFENIDFRNDLDLEYIDDRKTYKLEVIFTDDITSKNFTASSEFTVEMSDYEIQIVHSPKDFKIGLPYSFTLMVTKTVDEYPVIDSTEPIYVVIRDDKNETFVDKEFRLDPILGSIEIYTPDIPEGTQFLNIFAKFDKIQYIHQINASISQSSESIAINVLTARPRMYEEVNFELITTSKRAPFAVFQIFSKGLLKMSKLIPLEYGYANFTIIPKFSYTPKAHCITYLITDGGDLISDSITLHFDNQFPNFVQINVDSTNSISPGSIVSLNITSTLYSSVYLLAIDKRGTSQRFKHDILKDYVFDNELVKYDRASRGNFYDFDIPFWFYPLSYQKSFFEIGALVLTNAIQNIPCAPENTSFSVFERIEENDEYLKNIKIDDFETHIDGFSFQTVTIDEPSDEVGIKGERFLEIELPEVSTSWAFTAITMNHKYGFGMTKGPFYLESYKRFFIDYTAPTFVKRGEIFLIEILIGNLYDEKTSTTVQVYNYDYQGLKISRSWIYEWVETVDGVLRNVDIPPYNVHRLLLEISAETYGSSEIEIAATCLIGEDSKTSTVNVIPEGFLTHIIDTNFINAENCESSIFKTLKCKLNEQDIIADTLTAQVAIYTDIMGLTLSNLDALFKEPIGNAEEILFVFGLNVLTLDYLVLTNQLSASIKTKVVTYLKQNYQKLIRYRNIDGSFSSFDRSNVEGSVWLTANILRYLKRAQRYLLVDENIFIHGLVFIASKQEPCGKFRNDEKSFSDSTNNTDASFTAFIGILFKENINAYSQYVNVMQRAVEYVERNYDKNNLYSLALVTYFMYEIDSPLKYELLQNLLSYIQRFSSRDTVTFKEYGAKNVTSIDVEINSYCLMILDHIPELYAEALNIVQWLIIKQNYNGLFVSAKTTIIALEAISRFAARLPNTNNNLEIYLSPNSDDDHTIFTRSMELQTQLFQLPPTTQHLDISAYGDGFAIVQLSYSYYAYSTQTNNAIQFSIDFKEKSCNDYLLLTLSLNISLNDISDILIVSVESPSGFVYDLNDDNLPSCVMNILELHKGTLLHIYLKNFEAVTTFDLTFIRKFVVFNESLSNIEVFDFNNENIKTSLFYKAPEDILPCANRTLATSPPIYDFTTLEPLLTEFNIAEDTITKKTEGIEFGTEEDDNMYDDEVTTIEADSEYRIESFTDDEENILSENEYDEETTLSYAEMFVEDAYDQLTNSDVLLNPISEVNEDYLSEDEYTETTEYLNVDDENSSDLEEEEKILFENDVDEESNKVLNSEIFDLESTTESEKLTTNEIFLNQENVDVDFDDSEDILNQKSLDDGDISVDYDEAKVTTTKETTTTYLKESFSKNKPRALPNSFKKPQLKIPKIPKISKLPNKIRKLLNNNN